MSFKKSSLKNAQTDLPVLLPYSLDRGDSSAFEMVRRLGQLKPKTAFIIVLGLGLMTLPLMAQSQYTFFQATSALFKWIPFLFFEGFLFNILISILSMSIGTLLGVVLAFGQLSLWKPIKVFSQVLTQFFRNSPWLVLLFVVLLGLPYELHIFGLIIDFPAWLKAVIGLSLPIMANISEVIRGAVASIPKTQWEVSQSLAFNRRDTLLLIILPQCFKRMIPPWMNWYSILTMATPLCSILGVDEVVNLARQAIESENSHPELLVPFYLFCLILFFLYCYPIAKWTIRLEKKYAVKF